MATAAVLQFIEPIWKLVTPLVVVADPVNVLVKGAIDKQLCVGIVLRIIHLPSDNVKAGVLQRSVVESGTVVEAIAGAAVVLEFAALLYIEPGNLSRSSRMAADLAEPSRAALPDVLLRRQSPCSLCLSSPANWSSKTLAAA